MKATPSILPTLDLNAPLKWLAPDSNGKNALKIVTPSNMQ